VVSENLYIATTIVVAAGNLKPWFFRVLYCCCGYLFVAFCVLVTLWFLILWNFFLICDYNCGFDMVYEASNTVIWCLQLQLQMIFNTMVIVVVVG
jgi:hypothetical protein